MSAATAIGDLLGWKVEAIQSGKRFERTPRRDSYDENDPRAQIFVPICGGNRKKAVRWCAKLLKVAREFNTHHKEKGKREGPLGSNGLWVLEVMLGFVDYATGQCDPALDTICKAAKLARQTVVNAQNALVAHGFLQKARRTRKTGRARGEGPLREQISTAYAFGTKLAGKLLMRFRQLVGGKERVEAIQAKKKAEAHERARLLSAPTGGLGTSLFPNDPALAAKLDAIGASFDAQSASLVTREYPLLDL